MAARAGLDAASVIRAAVALVDEAGAEALSLAAIADRVGVKTPSLYKHVAGLEGVRRGLALWGIEELTRRLGRAAVGLAGDEALAAIAGAYRAFAHAHPGVYPFTLRAPAQDDDAMIAASEELLAIVRAVLAPYGLDQGGAIQAIRAFRSLLHGFVSLEQAGGFGLPVDLDESYARLIRLLAGSLRNEGQRPGAWGL